MIVRGQGKLSSGAGAGRVGTGGFTGPVDDHDPGGRSAHHAEDGDNYEDNGHPGGVQLTQQGFD